MTARHEDHDPSIICRPAGFGLCEPVQLRRISELGILAAQDPAIKQAREQAKTDLARRALDLLMEEQ